MTLFHSPNIWNETLLKADSAKEGLVLPWMLRLRGFTQIRTQPFKSSPIGIRRRRTTQTRSYVPFVLFLQGSLYYFIELPTDSLISYPGLPHAFDRLKWMLRHHSQGQALRTVVLERWHGIACAISSEWKNIFIPETFDINHYSCTADPFLMFKCLTHKTRKVASANK